MSSKIFPQSFTKDKPMAQKGEGVYIYTEDGKRYLDGCCGAMTANLGHSQGEIIDSIKQQLDNVAFVHRIQFRNQSAEELAERLVAMAPKGLDMVIMVNSGSEATEMAMKTASDYWNLKGLPRKKRILTRWPSYHGATIGALSLCGQTSRRLPYMEYLRDWPTLELPFCHRCPYEKKYPECNVFCARHLQKIIDRFGAETISAVMCEPITGAAGAGITPPDEYFPILRDICSKNNILLIFDEVITGVGRTGKKFACEHWNVVPDVIVFAKGVSSGYGPMAGIIISDEVYDSIYQNRGDFGLTGHTFSGNPLSAAGAAAVLRYIEEHDVIAGVEEKGKYFKAKLDELYEKYEFVTNIRGKGLLWGLELSKNKDTLEPFGKADNITGKLVDIAFENGLLVYPSQGFIDGIVGDSLLLTPPLIIQKEEIDEMCILLDKSLSELEKML